MTLDKWWRRHLLSGMVIASGVVWTILNWESIAANWEVVSDNWEG